MTVERHRRDTRSRSKYKHHNRRCHFQGRVRDDDASSVALSACNGIVSWINSFKIYRRHFFKQWHIFGRKILQPNSFFLKSMVNCSSKQKYAFSLDLDLFWFNVTNLPRNCNAQSNKSWSNQQDHLPNCAGCVCVVTFSFDLLLLLFFSLLVLRRSYL